MVKSRKKKCLVLGADGFLGSHLVDDLVARGFDVRAFDRFRGGRTKHLGHLRGRVEFRQGDFMNRRQLERALKGVDYVFHFVSLTTPASTADDPRMEIDFNLRGTLQLLDLAVKHGVKKIVYPSSGGAVYGNALEEIVDETVQPRPVSPYAVTKLMIEEYLHYYSRRYGLDFVIYRIANPYGERQNPDGIQGAIPIFMKHMMLGEPVTLYGDTVRDYVYVKDVTGFIAENFNRRGARSTYNVGSGRGVALTELVPKIARVAGRSSKVVSRKKRSFDVDKIVLDISRANEEFGFRPTTSLEVGLEKTHAYLAERTDAAPVSTVVFPYRAGMARLFGRKA